MLKLKKKIETGILSFKIELFKFEQKEAVSTKIVVQVEKTKIRKSDKNWKKKRKLLSSRRQVDVVIGT